MNKFIKLSLQSLLNTFIQGFYPRFSFFFSYEMLSIESIVDFATIIPAIYQENSLTLSQAFRSFFIDPSKNILEWSSGTS